MTAAPSEQLSKKPNQKVELPLGEVSPAASNADSDKETILKSAAIELEAAIACLSGLTGVLETVREDLRSLRIMLASNLILVFSVPIATLAVQDRYVFIEPLPPDTFAAGIRALLPYCIMGIWAAAVIVFGRTIPTLLERNEKERHAESEIVAVTDALTRNDIIEGVKRLSSSIRYYIEAVAKMREIRKPFMCSFVLFVIAISIELLLYLFAPLRR